MRAVLLLVLLAACGSNGFPLRRARGSAPPVVVGEAVPVVKDAAVVAFWLAAVDTLPEKSRRAIQKEFRRSNDAIAGYLSDTDVAMVTTLSDTVVVEAGDERYLVLLSGFDFPFGYLLVEPGYDEEFHTGLTIDQDLEAAIDEYFELEEVDSLDRRRIAAAGVSLSVAKGRSFTRGTTLQGTANHRFHRFHGLFNSDKTHTASPRSAFRNLRGLGVLRNL